MTSSTPVLLGNRLFYADRDSQDNFVLVTYDFSTTATKRKSTNLEFPQPGMNGAFKFDFIYTNSYPKKFYILSSTDNIDKLFLYDTVTESLTDVNLIMSTSYQLVYSYGICDGFITSSFVNVSSSMDYSVVCQKPNGFYYQSPNIYYRTPLECAGLQAIDLLTDCPSVKNNFNAFLSSTCPDSIHKVCSASFSKNPPFSCSKSISTNDIYTTLTLAQSQAGSIWGILSILIGSFLTYKYKTTPVEHYENVKAEDANENDIEAQIQQPQIELKSIKKAKKIIVCGAPASGIEIQCDWIR
jgi:hypothetical protein